MHCPAEYGCFPSIDKIFSRIGTSDDFESSASTFYLEMQEMSHIIGHATQHSLIIIDELGRGTSNQDGIAIAWACCEHLINLRALTLFATHYSELQQLASIYPNVENWTLSVEATKGGLQFLYKVIKGFCQEGSYGM